ncbi:MAG: VOC family protein, partial [Chloroflexi bacterium]|nr:VOC family protein [Chloroflexota bacterium]
LKFGIAVRDLDEATRHFTEVLGLVARGPRTYEPFSLRYDICPVGDTMLELMESTTPDGPIARFIDEHGEGLQHICLRVPDLEEAVSQLKQRGIEFVQETPTETESSLGRLKFVFARPKSFRGVLVQLAQVL